MSSQIIFPNLGIVLPNVGRIIDLGFITIAYYGICIAAGMALGITAIMLRAKECGRNPDSFLDLSVIALMCGVVGARIYYVIFSFADYKDDLLSIFNIREGGLAIYGGIIGGFIAVYVITRVRRTGFAETLDICVIGVPIGQILGRWGNFFNREAFGAYTDGLLAMQLPVDSVRINEITQEMWENVETIGGVQFISVHPAFLYEGLWNLFVLAVLILMRKRTKAAGELFLIYALLYGAGRFFIERLRTDQLLIPGTSLPVSMVLSAAAVLVSAILIGWRRHTAE